MAGPGKDRPWFRTRRPRRSLLAGRNRRRPQLEPLEAYVLLSNTYTVMLTTDDGQGDVPNTLSWAIDQVNVDTSDTSTSPDTIAFAIPNVTSATITPSVGEANIIRPVIIDGTTQGGAGNTQPAIQLDGSSAEPGAIGLVLFTGSDGSSVLGLSITNWSYGILLQSGSNTIANDDIGVDLGGSTAAGNSLFGVNVQSASNTIGGTAAADLNVISGNKGSGLSLSGSGTMDNVVKGDYIGTNATGDTGLGNANGGVYISGGAYGNTVAGCTIASNQGGVNISGSGTSHNVVEGDYIGTDAAGDTGLGNTLVGVTIYSGATDNTIGGTTADAADVIAGNLGGVGIENTGTSDNVVEGNFIGTDVAGDTDLGNFVGIQILGGATDNTIGGTASGAGNTISDNGFDGVGLNGPATSANLVAGNTISDNGNAGVAVSRSGSGGPTGNFIGGSSAAYGNDISGNHGAGIYIYGSGTVGNLVAANTITDNTGDGVDIFASSAGATGNAIGGTAAAYANIITSNGGNGIYISGSGTTGNLAAGNFIGTDASDDIGLGNSLSGVRIDKGASGNTISDDVIAASGLDGVTIDGDGTSGNLVEGNDVGTNASGSVVAGLGNSDSGIAIFGGAASNTLVGNTIGGNATNTSGFYGGIDITDDGTSSNVVEGNWITDNTYDGVDVFGGATGNTIGGIIVGEGNTITLNGFGGVYISGSDGNGTATSGNVVVGNFIGTDANDDTGMGNVLVGVTIFGGATGNEIGELPVAITSTGVHTDTIAHTYGNTIDSNGAGGVDIENSGTMGNSVVANYIGTDAAGDTDLGNTIYGVDILQGATGNTIGGTVSAARNTIADNTSDGVHIAGTGTSGNLVAGNTISANQGNGVAISASSNGSPSSNIIGGSSAGYANTITSNHGAGIYIYGSGTIGNLVAGNDIGTDADGDTGLGNSGNGIEVTNGADKTTIGGTVAGSGNVIASNRNSGLALVGPSTSGDTIEGNDIGTDANGDSGLGNAFWGVYVDDVPDVVVGAAGAGDVISGNKQGGVTFRGIDSIKETIQGNLIGVAPNGTSALGNSYSGVLIGDWGVSGDYPSQVTIGGTTSGSGNVVSANGEWGVWISGASVTGVVVEGNSIGTDANSDTGLGNDYSGVQIDSGATKNTVGGTAAGDGNLIVANDLVGVEISDTGTSQNVVEGNLIGLNASQTPGLGNTYDGVFIVGGASSNTVGGTAAGAANTIGSNGLDGVAISGSGTTTNVVEGNDIGTDSASDTGLGNGADGVEIFSGASGNTIGGSSTAARNVISGNTLVGVAVFDGGPSGNTIQGNDIGTNVGGTGPLPNKTTGVLLGSDGTAGQPSSDNTVIDNVISGNGESGVAVENASGNTIEDNLIGTDAAGTAAVGNGWDGVRLTVLLETPTNIGTGAPDNTVEGNTIAANGLYGVLIEYAGSKDNLVQDNAIGTVLGNMMGGVMIDLGASGNTIGGTTSTANVISGNGGAGVTISDSGTSSNLVAGNAIGTIDSNTTGLENMGDGVSILDGATGNTVGGTTTAAANTIANNTGNGVSISTIGTTGNVVEGNFIGTNSAGATDLGNSGDGVEVFDSASGNMVGGTVAGAGNVIDDNKTGVVIGSSPTDAAIHDAISGNSIYGNTTLGIDLGDDGVTLNDSDGHSGPNLFQDFPVITNAYTVGSTTTITGTVSGPANSTLRVELFSNSTADPSGYGQGKVFLGNVTVTTGVGGGGSFTFTTNSPVAVGRFVSATATDAKGNTSEFAKDVTVSAKAPLDIGYQITGPVANPIKHTYTETVKLTNDGTTSTPSFKFVLEGLTTGVTLTNASGTTTDGSPYVTVGSLSPGSSVTVTLTFTKTSSTLFINYTPEFIAIVPAT